MPTKIVNDPIIHDGRRLQHLFREVFLSRDIVTEKVNKYLGKYPMDKEKIENLIIKITAFIFIPLEWHDFNKTQNIDKKLHHCTTLRKVQDGTDKKEIFESYRGDKQSIIQIYFFSIGSINSIARCGGLKEVKLIEDNKILEKYINLTKQITIDTIDEVIDFFIDLVPDNYKKDCNPDELEFITRSRLPKNSENTSKTIRFQYQLNS